MSRGIIQHKESEVKFLKLNDFQRYRTILETEAERVITDDSALSHFCKEKAILAAESAEFYLKQRYQRLSTGLPADDDPYWLLIERNLDAMEKVCHQLYKQQSGYVFFLYDEFPEVALWLCLSRSLELIEPNITCYAISLIDVVDEETWLKHAQLSTASYFKTNLEYAVNGNHDLSSLCFVALEARREVNSEFASKLIRRKSDRLLTDCHQYLAKQNQAESTQWTIENTSVDDNLFLHLLIRENRSSWYRERVMTNEGGMNSLCFAQILMLPEMDKDFCIDLHSSYADVLVVLSGRPDLTGDILALFDTELEESLVEKWVNVLFFLFGETLPISPRDLGIDVEIEDAVQQLKIWWDDYKYNSPATIRLGHKIDFDATVSVLESPCLNARLRLWVWKELCIACRMYIHYNPYLSPVKQRRLLLGLKTNKTAKERFNLRIRNAVVGY